MDELLDLVDDHDHVIGQAWRSEIYQQGWRNFRVVNAFLKNSHGQLWIPRRAPHKRLFPLALDMSMGGHVASGETYFEAFQREVQEELGLDVSTLSTRRLGICQPIDGVSAFMHVYEVDLDTTPPYNPDDFIEADWLTPQEILHRIRTGDPSKDDLSILVQTFYA